MNIHADRIPALDGVRGIALLTVLLCHTDPQVFPGGNIGVDLFFVLSGYLISTILLREHHKNGRISLVNFYIRRALRLLPALIGVVAVVLVWTLLFNRAMAWATIKDAVSILLYIYNWRLSFDASALSTFHNVHLIHLWSLSVEEQFYWIWPLTVAGLMYFKASRWLLLATIAAGIILPAIGRFALWQSGPSLDLYFRTDLRFDNLMWGALVAWIAHYAPRPNDLLIKVIWLAAPLALLLFFWHARFDFLSGGYLYRGGFTVVGALSAIVIISAIFTPPTTSLNAFFQIPALRWTGMISYGLYLWHLPIFHLAYSWFGNLLLKNSFAFAVTFAISALSYYKLELPFLHMKDRLREEADLPGSTGMSTANEWLAWIRQQAMAHLRASEWSLRSVRPPNGNDR